MGMFGSPLSGHHRLKERGRRHLHLGDNGPRRRLSGLAVVVGGSSRHDRRVRLPNRILSAPLGLTDCRVRPVPNISKPYRTISSRPRWRVVARRRLPRGVCRAATIINPPRPSKYIPDRRRLPIQIVALQSARTEGRLAKVDPDLALQHPTHDFWFHHIPALSRIFLHRARISNPRSGQ